MDQSQTVALACVPGAICSSARGAHFALIKKLFREDLLEMTELEQGFEFTFPPSAIASLMNAAVARFSTSSFALAANRGARP